MLPVLLEARAPDLGSSKLGAAQLPSSKALAMNQMHAIIPTAMPSNRTLRQRPGSFTQATCTHKFCVVRLSARG
jgi:hypothetical protein